jgi:osmotically inducible lipoprotein OsmB
MSPHESKAMSDTHLDTVPTRRLSCAVHSGTMRRGRLHILITAALHTRSHAMKLRPYTLAALFATALATAGCSTSPTNAQIGTGVGAVAGGVAGNVLFGTTLGTVGGAAAGALIGNEVGKRR